MRRAPGSTLFGGFLRAFFASTLLLATLPAAFAAWESHPEFQSLTEAEAQEFEGPHRLGSEYFSTLLTYSKPHDWEYLWLRQPKTLDLSFGSLNTQRFMTDQRLKIHARVSPLVEFRFLYLDEQNQELQSLHHMLELVFHPFERVGFALYGEPSFRKPNDDTGVALLFWPSERHEIRLFNTFVDVTRLKYPDTPDSFIEPELPYVRGLSGRWWSDSSDAETGEFVEYAARYETPTRWRFFEQNYDLRYWKWAASLYGRRQIAERQSLTSRLQLDRKIEERQATGPTPARIDSWETSRFTALVETAFQRVGPTGRWTVSTGLEYLTREWQTLGGTARYREYDPFVELALPIGGGAPGRSDLLRIRYIATFHHEEGPEFLGIAPGDKTEHKLSFSYGIALGDMGLLVLLASADLDRAFTRRSWGGGSGQLRLGF